MSSLSLSGTNRCSYKPGHKSAGLENSSGTNQNYQPLYQWFPNTCKWVGKQVNICMGWMRVEREQQQCCRHHSAYPTKGPFYVPGGLQPPEN